MTDADRGTAGSVEEDLAGRPSEEPEEARRRFESAFEHAAIGMALVGLDGRWLQVNRSLCRITGYPERELSSKTFQDITYPEDLNKDLEQASKLLTGEIESYHMEKRYVRRDGSFVWILLSASLVRTPEGHPRYFIAQVQDINERKDLEERLAHMARHDALTGLPNRAAFLERLEGALAGADRRSVSVALLFVDLDGFKAVNDALGHCTGDSVLVESARRLRSCVRLGDVVARLGGDEFVVMAENISEPEALGLAGRIVRGLGEPVRIGVLEAGVGASVGVAIADPGRRCRSDDLLRRADEAMYKAKSEGGTAYRISA